MLEIAVLFIISIILRIGVVLNSRTYFDTFGHLYFAKEVKDQKVGPFGKIQTKVAGTKGFKSQFVWHWLMGFLPLYKIIKFEKWINPFFDVIFTLLIYFISIQYGLDNRTSFLVALIYLLTPMWFSGVSTGPRIKSLTPRLSSEIITNLFFIVTVLPLGIPYSIQLILGTVFSSFVILSFRFGLQAIFFLTPLISLFAVDFTPLFSTLIAIFLSIIISKGDFLETLKYQLIHLQWYFKKNLKGEMTISNRNSLKKLFSKSKDKKGIDRILAVIHDMIALNSFSAVLLKMPVYVLSLGGIIYLYLNEMAGVLPQSVVDVVLGGTIIYLLVNIPILLFIGEAERYLNHIAYFIILSAVIIAEQLNLDIVIYALLLYGLLYWVFESFFLHKLRTEDETSDKFSEEVFNFIKGKNERIILTFPYHAIGGIWRIMLHTKHKVVCHMASDGDYRKKLEKKYALNYPYLNLNLLEEMSSEYGVNLLIIDNKKLKVHDFEGWSPPSNWEKVKVGGEYFSVYERKN